MPSNSQGEGATHSAVPSDVEQKAGGFVAAEESGASADPAKSLAS